MKNKSAILEYCVARRGGRRKWGFCFKTPDGQTLIESLQQYDSQAKAEKGFCKLVKSIATNDYAISITE